MVPFFLWLGHHILHLKSIFVRRDILATGYSFILYKFKKPFATVEGEKSSYWIKP
jgi:hypothetical protein